MAMIVRDTRFCMTVPESNARRTTAAQGGSFSKKIERRIVNVWKVVTRTTRRRQRASVFARDFVLVNARRRSTLPAQLYQYHA